MQFWTTFRSDRPVWTIFPSYIIPNGTYERRKKGENFFNQLILLLYSSFFRRFTRIIISFVTFLLKRTAFLQPKYLYLYLYLSVYFLLTYWLLLSPAIAFYNVSASPPLHYISARFIAFHYLSCAFSLQQIFLLRLSKMSEFQDVLAPFRHLKTHNGEKSLLCNQRDFVSSYTTTTSLHSYYSRLNNLSLSWPRWTNALWLTTIENHPYQCNGQLREDHQKRSFLINEFSFFNCQNCNHCIVSNVSNH